MAQKIVQGSKKLAESIKKRRNELNLTIEAAAVKAGVGTKTWCRYEAGESIRQDKYRGVCRALNWLELPNEYQEENPVLNLEEYRNHKAWSRYLEECFGEIAAASFAIGSDILLDYVKEDMGELLKLTKGAHIGQIGVSYLADELPKQFCMQYDYDFLYALYTSIVRFRKVAHAGAEMVAHTVLEELMLYLVVMEAQVLLEISDYTLESDWDEWIYDLFGDMDIITCLYSDQYLVRDNSYHFEHWMEEQFYCE